MITVLRLANGEPPVDPNQAPQPGDWVQDGFAQREWSPPEDLPPASNATSGDRGWFWLRLFTQAERGRWLLLLRHAATLTPSQLVADPWLYGVVMAEADINRANTVNLAEPTVIAGVSGLCRHTFTIDGLAVTVLETDARRDEVLAGVVVS